MMKSQSPPPLLPITNPSSKSNKKMSTMVLHTSNDEFPTTHHHHHHHHHHHLIVSPSSTLDDFDSHIETKPLLSRAFSFTGGLGLGKIRQQRRRRTVSDENLLAFQNGNGGGGNGGNGGSDHSIVSSVEHVASETWLVTRLSLKLLGYLGVGYRWITRFLALGCYAILLIPGFFQVGYHYFRSSHIRRSIVYGDQPRNSLDLYLPKNSEGPKPVVAFITGGAWIIGYKAWGSLLGQQLADRDIIVACIDYRNFPQGTMRDMIDDASRGISFICKNVAEYGGDPERVYVMGQSAGAHIAACVLVEQAIKEIGEGDTVTWSISQIKAYFGLSGGYNLMNLVDHFHNRGLYRNIFLSIMEGEQSLQRYSPELIVQDPNVRSAVSLLPPIVLFHGTADYSIPSDASESFAATLQRLGVDARAILYEGKTHTDVFLQDPMRGGSDQMFEDLVSIIHAGDEEALAKDATAPPRKRLVPEIMLKLARAVSPF
ncbi:isoprenylcysteine alpha-carbonyl methylesterase ICME-like [Silene latifolia]|uniref:isoprenylcysteine alpha-carbonyl methylesterase ICME-like n=1 Tax=Silene latifolia TaxID=37657 RepID=UPI003D7744FA